MSFNPKTCKQLFHGTIENIEGTLRPGSYDGVFWTAETSAIAQTYIPAAGARVNCGVSSYLLDQTVSPSKHGDACYELAQSLGPVAYDIEWDQFDRAKSYRVPKGALTYREVANHIENVLGYVNKGIGNDRDYELLFDGLDPETKARRYVRADFKQAGSLVIVTGGFEGMRFFDMSLGESDLTSLQYHAVGRFRAMEKQGYDGVIIDDFTKSKTWGDVGHRSIGFFKHAVEKLETEIIPAVRFDWEDGNYKALQVTDTPEYLSWKAAREARALIDEQAMPTLAPGI